MKIPITLLILSKITTAKQIIIVSLVTFMRNNSQIYDGKFVLNVMGDSYSFWDADYWKNNWKNSNTNNIRSFDVGLFHTLESTV